MWLIARGAVVLVAVAMVVLAWPHALGGATSYVVVAGDSMEPTYETGDLVVTRAADDYEVGDVIAFRTEDGDVIHRIVGGDATDGFVTQGDNVADVDPYRPTPDQVLGRHVLHVPAIGGWGLRLVSIVPAPVLALGAALLAVGGDQQRRRSRRRPRQLPSVTVAQASGEGEEHGSPSLLGRTRVVAAAVLVVLAVALLPTVFLSWRAETTTEVPATEATASHTVTMEVTGQARTSSSLYPEGRSPTLTASPGGDGAVPADAQPLLRRLVDEVVVDVTYEPTTDAGEGTATGAVEVALVTGRGFVLPLDGVEAEQFTGTWTTTVGIDLDEADAALATYREEAGLPRDSGTVRVVPSVVTAEGTVVRGEPLELLLGDDVVTIGGSLRTVVTPTGAEGGTVTTAATAGLLGIELPVPLLRGIATVLLVVLVGGAVALLRREECDAPHLRVQLLYGSMLVDIDEDANIGGEVVRVTSIAELARLAKRDQRTILHQERAGGRHHYLVPDGELTFEYVIDAGTDVDDGTDTDADADAETDATEAVSPPGEVTPPQRDGTEVAASPRTRTTVVRRRAVVVVEDFTELLRIWREDNEAPGRIQQRRLADGSVRYSVVRDGREYVHVAGRGDT